MNSYSLAHLSDSELLRQLIALVVRDRATTAAMLAHIAEVDERKLYLPAAYPSMFAYCVHELRLSEDSAFKRIRAARTARRFPVIFDDLAEGRLNLSAVVLLTPYLTEETAGELLAAADHKTRSEIEQLLADRFPSTELLSLLHATPTAAAHACQLAPGPVGTHTSGENDSELAARPVETTMPRPRVTPLAPQRFAVQFSAGQGFHDKLRRAQELLSHQVPAGEVAEVLDRALDALIEKLERARLAATSRPQRKRRPTRSTRHIPAQVKRAVYERDGSQCTFVSESGKRCPSRTRLEFDHAEEVARGGEATIGNVRLRCRAHNQYAAERTFGAEFMARKREAARRAADERRVANHSAGAAATNELVQCLRRLGYRAGEAIRAAEHCAAIANAPLESRIRAALAFLRIPVRVERPAAAVGGAETGRSIEPVWRNAAPVPAIHGPA